MNDRHPDASTLEAFAQGRLGNRRMNEVESHLKDCLACGRALEVLPADRLSQLLRRGPEGIQVNRESLASEQLQAPAARGAIR